VPLSTVWNKLKVLERNSEEGPGLQKGKNPQPDQVQEAYAREAEENQHTHQDSGRGNDQIPLLFMASIYRNQQ
jgi:hypothetical protein